MCDFETKSREEGEKRNGIVYIYHFHSRAVEAGFYGDTGRVIGFFNEVKQRRPRLVPRWVIAVLDFVEDLVSRYMKDDPMPHFSDIPVYAYIFAQRFFEAACSLGIQ